MWWKAANGKVGPGTFFSANRAFPLGVAALLAGSFLYVWLRVEPVLDYHTCGPYFYRHRAFLETFLGRPGGLANYAGVLLAQLNCLNWLGALIFVVCQGAVFLTTRFVLAKVSGKESGFPALVPLFILLGLRNHYGCPVFALSVGLLLALSASAAYLSWAPPRSGPSAIVSGLISGLLFLLAGLWASLLFAVMAASFLSIQRRNWWTGLWALVLAAPAPLLVVGTGQLEIAWLVQPWPEGIHWALPATLYASVPVLAAVLLLLPNVDSTVDAHSIQSVKARSPLPENRGLQPVRLRQAMVGLTFLLGCTAVWLNFDQQQKIQAEIDYYTSRGRYDAVLTAARHAAALNHPAKVRLQLALYHTGRLAEDLFSFLNKIGDAPLKGLGEEWRAQSEPLFELGLINDAEHMAHEALELEGERPGLLRLLARIYLLKNRPEAAQVFLNVLSLIPFQGAQANEAWPAVNLQTLAAERAAVARMRLSVMTNDVPHDSVGPMLDVALASSPTNQMAFEYVMAHHMIDLDLTKTVERLRWLDHFHYAQIPRPYEEALLLYQQLAGVQVEWPGRAIRPETVERFREFKEAARQLTGTAEDLTAMVANFGDTYWCYYYAHLMTKQTPDRPASAR